jgi:hypothetical protein
MRQIVGLHNKNGFIIGLLALVLLGTSAEAQVVTLACKRSPPNPVADAELGGALNLDIDLGKRTVTFLTGNPPRTVTATVNDRFVSWSNPYIALSERLDRKTGLLQGATPQGQRMQEFLCERVGGAPVL